MDSQSPTALTINAGSSSIKYAVFSLLDLSVLYQGEIKQIGEKQAKFQNHKVAFEFLIEDIRHFPISTIAHRVVHGGVHYFSTTLITKSVLNDLHTLSKYAPLHQPHNLYAIELLMRLWPDIPQYADFDTAFHKGHEPVADCYALPKDLRDKNLKKYGFHGLSYESICATLEKDFPDLYKGKYVIAHLGNGASLCAVEHGKSVDSTMGLTALEGLPMGTRSGSVDPGLILYLAQEMGKKPDEISDILYHRSGLLGLSNISNDVKILEQSQDKDAQFALDFFAYKTAQHVAMMAVSLSGMDTVIFTGGIGENSTFIRDSVLSHLSFLPKFKTLVLKTNEEWMMACHVKKIIGL